MSKTTRGKHISQLNYLAGFFDGEGSIYITRINNKRSGNIWYRLGLGCSNSDKRPIDLLHKVFSPIRTTYSYVPGRKKGYKPAHSWLATGNVAKEFLEIIEPYLMVKKEQARLGIKFQEWRNSLPNTGKPRPSQNIKKCEWYRQKMKKLNGII